MSRHASTCSFLTIDIESQGRVDLRNGWSSAIPIRVLIHIGQFFQFLMLIKLSSCVLDGVHLVFVVPISRLMFELLVRSSHHGSLAFGVKAVFQVLSIYEQLTLS